MDEKDENAELLRRQETHEFLTNRPADEVQLVTDDDRIKTSKVDPTDERVLDQASKGESVISSEEELDVLVQAALATRASFDELVANMTMEQAQFVRKIRVDEDDSWRGVAHACYEAWNGDWDPPSNQLMGMALCERAAYLMGESPNEAPWN